MAKDKCKNIKLLLFILFFGVLSILLSAEQIPSQNSFHFWIKKAFQNYLSKELKSTPIRLFPLSKLDFLKILNKRLKEDYFLIPKVSRVGLKVPHGNYFKKVNKGAFREIVVYFSDFLIKGLELEEAYLILRIKISRLSNFIRKESQKFGIVFPEITSNNKGQLRVNGEMKFLIYSGNVDVEGYPWVDEKNYLRFKITKCKTDSGNVPGFIIETISNIINPLFYFKKFMFELQTEVLKITKDDIVLKAVSRKFKHKKMKIKFKNEMFLKYLKNI